MGDQEVPDVDVAEKKHKTDAGVPKTESKFSLDFAACNLLHNSPYTRYNKHACMTPATRSQKMCESLYDGPTGVFFGATILAFQEWPLDRDESSLTFREMVRSLYRVEEYRQTSSFGCAVAYNAAHFRLIQSQALPFRCKGGNGGLSVILQPLQEGGPPLLGIISMHLPFGKVAEATAEIADYIKRYPSSDRVAWVVAGDCNSNKRDVMLNTFQQSGIVLQSANTKGVPTHRSGSDKHEEYDYIFYSSSLTVSRPLTVTPSTFPNLLSHTVPQKFTEEMFFSDHAALRVAFSASAR